MTGDPPEERAADIGDICMLKHRYFRMLDLKEFRALGDLLTDEATAAYGDIGDELQGRDAIVSFLEESLSSGGIISLHNGHHPEITFSGADHAVGIWYLVDRVIIPEADLEIGGSALYDDVYVRRRGRWLIHHTGYRRMFEERRRHKSGELLSFSSRFGG
jgi:hypothetical protein